VELDLHFQSPASHGRPSHPHTGKRWRSNVTYYKSYSGSRL